MNGDAVYTAREDSARVCKNRLPLLGTAVPPILFKMLNEALKDAQEMDAQKKKLWKAEKKAEKDEKKKQMDLEKDQKGGKRKRR